MSDQKKVTTPPHDEVTIHRAVISVHDKRGLDALARELSARGVQLYSTGGTEHYLKNLGLPVTSVSELTNSPEIFEGRVKTLHPMVHGGLLYKRETPSHLEEAKANGILPLDLLIGNLYPFEATVAKPGATEEEIIEQIDIGGPAMLRSAAKNFRSVAVLTSPDQYEGFLEMLASLNGATDITYRKELACAAFEHVARYDRIIADYFEDGLSLSHGNVPNRLELSLPLVSSLRYGENPHQHAGLFGTEFSKICTQLWGKELSYNNILDISSSLGLIAEFLPAEPTKPVAAIIKHTNPCGVAEGATPLDAFERAFTTDPESPFGGIIVLNSIIDAPLAERLNQFFSEVILAPSFDEDALTILRKKKDRRLLTYIPENLAASISNMVDIRSVVGGILFQTQDDALVTNSELISVTSHPVTTEITRGLLFAMRIVKHLKSNAIAFCALENGFARSVALGAGQTSRVESTRIAIEHAKRHGLSLEGSFVASDAFYPFADSMIEAANVGVKAVIQPGGSVRDAEVIQAAEDHGIALVMTGIRHFRH